MIHYDVLILEDGQAQPANLTGPGGLAGVVLVVARHEVRAVPGREFRQGCGVSGKLVHGSIHQISGHRDEIGAQIVHACHQPLDEIAANRGADVHVADLGDRKPMERRRQPPDGNVDVHDARPAGDREADRR